MRLFLTIEAQNAMESGLAKIMQDTTKQLDFVTGDNVGLEDTDNYGTEFRSIGVIPSCASKRY